MPAPPPFDLTAYFSPFPSVNTGQPNLKAKPAKQNPSILSLRRMVSWDDVIPCPFSVLPPCLQKGAKIAASNCCNANVSGPVVKSQSQTEVLSSNHINSANDIFSARKSRSGLGSNQSHRAPRNTLNNSAQCLPASEQQHAFMCPNGASIKPRGSCASENGNWHRPIESRPIFAVKASASMSNCVDTHKYRPVKVEEAPALRVKMKQKLPKRSNFANV